MKSAGKHEQAGCNEYLNSHVLRILARRFLCNVNNMKALIGRCLLVMSYVGNIPDPWHGQAFTIAHIVK